MHKKVYQMVETISRYGILTQISSNLSVRLFDTQELERVVTSGIHSLLASIDGVTQTAYSAYRKNGDVSKALKNLENIQKTKKRLGSVTPHLTWAFYLNKYNENQVEKANRKAAEIGVDIWFKELSCPDEFQTRLVKTWPRIFTPPKNALDLWRPRINRGLDPFNLDSRFPKTCNVCRMPFEVMNINYNGDVYPCTAVVGNNFVVENLLNDTVEHIWEIKMAENRKQLLDVTEKRMSSQCLRCKHFPKSA